MLVLTRKPRQQIMIGDNIVINVVEVQGDNVRFIVAKSIGQFRRKIKRPQLRLRRIWISVLLCPINNY